MEMWEATNKALEIVEGALFHPTRLVISVPERLEEIHRAEQEVKQEVGRYLSLGERLGGIAF